MKEDIVLHAADAHTKRAGKELFAVIAVTPGGNQFRLT